MKDFSALLQRISNALGRDGVARDSVVECVERIVGFTLKAEDVALANSVLTISSSATKKNAIKLREIEIIRDLNDRCHMGISKIFYK